MYDEDHDWLEGWGYDPPPPVLVPNPCSQPVTPPVTRFNSPNRGGAPAGVACKRPRLPNIPERDDIGWGGGRASTDLPRPPNRPPTPPRPSRKGPPSDQLMEALEMVSQMLNNEQPEKRYEKKGFRAAVRQQLKKLCNRYNLRYPPWLDGSELTVRQYKLRVRWFIEDFMLQQAEHAQSPDGDGLGKACTPQNSPRDGKPQSGVSTPTGAGSPIGSEDDSSSSSSSSSESEPCAKPPSPPAAAEPAAGAVGDPPSSAAAIGHMMDNLLDDMEVLHPGVREEVQQTICAPQEGWPAQGPANPSSSLGTPGPAADPRETKSEPPGSPMPMDCDPAAEPAQPAEPAEPAGLSAIAEPPVEAGSGAATPMESETVATPGSWPAQGPNANMDGSWNMVSDASTVESVEMEED